MRFGSFAVPSSMLILFWEMNVPRNISIYEVAKMLFVGGAGSLVVTLFLYSMFPVYDLTYTGAIVVSIVEEIGQLVIIGYFIIKLNSKYILNGLLVGATIGTGFAAFESAGYTYNLGEFFGESNIILLRCWMSIGTLIVWSAIAGAVLVYVKGNDPLKTEHFTDPKFLRLLLVPITLHAIWDIALYFLHQFYLLFIMLIVVAWIFIYSFINVGLTQISRVRDSFE